MLRIPRALLTLVLLLGVATGAPSQVLAAPAKASDAALKRALASAMASAGPSSGAYVLNAADGTALYSRRAGRTRVLASNTKLYTTAAALARFGPTGRLPTTVLSDGELDESGVLRGNLYLRGGGDPSFGSRAFVRRAYGPEAADVETLADELEAIGVSRVEGRVIGDESAFDSLRGGPYSGFRLSSYAGPLTALAFNRGLAAENGSSFQGNPPAFAASRLDAALELRRIRVRRDPRAGVAPGDASIVATVESPPMARLATITNKRSDNFFAEVLLKDLAVNAGERGTTRGGAALAAGFASRLGAHVSLSDGSGLSRGNRAAPRQVVRFLDLMRERPEFPAFFDSLPVAGRDGTLRDRMRGGAARGRCRAKTGTLSNVSALSGYCKSRSGDTIVFSILMNGVYPVGARRLQDRMTNALAAYRG